MTAPEKKDRAGDVQAPRAAPALALPKGGGAIRSVGEKFGANPVTGTGALAVPIATSPGRSGFGPQLALAYNSGAGNGPFGFGWALTLPAIARKTEKGLPQYRDEAESDRFILAGAEDLVPVAAPDGLREEAGYSVQRYRPRVEGLFARIERWTRQSDGDVHWRTISRENILSLYGRESQSRIADPTAPSRVFSWLLCETRDDRGNAILYEYKAEDGTGIDLSLVHERNRGERNDPRRTANRYLKRIRYGNRSPLLDGSGHRPRFLSAAQLAGAQWLFEVVFDYGEHDLAMPTPDEADPWECRPDPFSVYRPGFELRTCRLVRRVLMFHHFAQEAGVGLNCLVSSTDLIYAHQQNPPDPRSPIHSFLTAVSQSGYRREGAGYARQSRPPVEFSYSQPQVQEQEEAVDSQSLENLPSGLDGALFQWVDLHGEGIPGILTEQAGGWFYKRNLSPISGGAAAFAPLERVAAQPNQALAGGQAQFLDLAGDGRRDLVLLDGPRSGLYEQDGQEGWAPFRPFAATVNRDLRDPHLLWIDLDGDGRADLLISQEDALHWHPSLGEEGFGPPRRVQQLIDEEKGPRLLFADKTQGIFLADLSGDGLTDLLRIRNGEVCYWPNLGYGSFGAKVTMDRAPRFDHPDQFDQRRIRLADIDGSGTTDILYLHRDGVQLYFNQSGNSWSEPQLLKAFPRLFDQAAVDVVDLLGNGTACLVWSSALPGDTGRPMRYVDLMGGQKPHLLIQVVNNMGAETHVRYAPSTRFYLADRLAGNPWVTRLPFPVHVVEQVEVHDQISRTRFATRYAYHHGYFDGEEREFAGFGMVEQQDTEAYEDYVLGVRRVEGAQELAPELWQPPVTTRTWYHTGAFLERERIWHQFQQEYYRQEAHLAEPVLPANLEVRDLRECLRALRGLPLRQEVYSFDGSPQEAHPFSVTENGFEVRLLQPRNEGRDAVCFAVARESISFAYERDPSDPRTAHSLNLDVDELGHVRLGCSVVYGRQIADPALPAAVARDQQQTYLTCAETEYTADIDQQHPAAAYRLRAAYESRTYELTGVAPAGRLFQAEELKAALAGAGVIGYETVADGLAPQKRLLAQSRTLFCDNSLSPLALGQWDSLGLVHESYQLACTPSLAAAYYAGAVTDPEFAAAGYRHLSGDANWWIPSGRAIYPADPAAHFYLPIGAQDPFGTETVATYDPYDLLVNRVQVKQALWNEVTAVNDYRVLGPVSITDINQNRMAVEVDGLGVVVKSAVMGKAGAGEGDSLADPTERFEYDLFQWMDHRKPNYVRSLSRERHGAANGRWQERYLYLDGSGGEVLVKAQVPPGLALSPNPDGTATWVQADPRWVGNGRTVLNNKGNPVKQYEPYFSTTPEYEAEEALRETGVTPIRFYDALGRNWRTLLPNGTLVRAEFSSWMQRAFDPNDTVTESQWYRDRGSPDPTAEPEPLHDPQRRAAWLAAKHAATPGVTHRDSLGRTIYAVSDYGGGVVAAVRSHSDLTGRVSQLFDQAGREVSSGVLGMTGTALVSESAEKGRRWTFHNVLGALVKTWDEHGRQFQTRYDQLQRPVATLVQEAGQAPILFSYVVYGDQHPNAAQQNLLGAAHQIFDQAGMVRVPGLDFMGNPLQVERRLALQYKQSIDWAPVAAQADYAAIQAAAEALLEPERFTAGAAYDALGRPTQVTLPDATVLVPTYNEANFLASLQAQISGQGSLVEFLQEQDYDAKGQRQFAHHGNGLLTRYFYDPKSFRLTRLLTCRAGGDPAAEALQDLHYVHDPVGNLTQIRDDAQQTHYFHNAVVRPESRFEYDAIYQLIRASGREHAALVNNAIGSHADLDFVPGLPHLNDAAAVRTYTEEYDYDLLGNIRQVRHQAGAAGSWTRQYQYGYEADGAIRTNRLVAARLPGDPEAGPFTGTYAYDHYGNMTRMPHLASMAWNFMDQLRQADLGGGGMAYYVYGVGGQRIRKVIERAGNSKLEWIYLGAVMIHRRRRRDSNALRLERVTVHISDGTGPIAQVDTKTRDEDLSDPANPLGLPLIRYQYANHIGSAVLETDEDGEIISYEEYHPYGTTAYRSARPGFDISLKRFRFSGKERDEETGLYYFGARYYAPWLGRWTSSDPAGFAGGLNLYRYCSNNPVMFHDPNGMQDRVSYALEELDLKEITDPKEFSQLLRDQGFDFTGYDAGGKPMAPDEKGRGQGLAKREGGNWDVGTWLKRPGEGETKGGGAEEKPAGDSPGPGGDGPSVPPRPAIDPNPPPTSPTPTNPIPKLDITQAPKGTDFAKEEKAARAAYRKEHNIKGRQTAVQHPQKWRDGARTNTHPRITNHPDFLHPISNRKGTGGMVDGRQYATQHTYADRGLYPRVAAQTQQKYGGFATERVTTLWAGQSVRQSITNSRGPLFLREYIVAPMLRGAGGHAALAATRTMVPFVVEAELGLMGAGVMLYNAGYASAGAAVFGAAAYVPVVGGGLVAGAVVGNAAEGLAREWGASEPVAQGTGALAATGGGAAVGALIGSVVPGVGTAIGAGVGAAAGLIGYGLSKLF